MNELENKKILLRPLPTVSDNRIAKTIRVFAKVYAVLGAIGGFILGMAFGTPNFFGETSFSWTAAIVSWVTTLFTTLLLLGFSEIIFLLDIRNIQQYQVEIKDE